MILANDCNIQSQRVKNVRRPEYFPYPLYFSECSLPSCGPLNWSYKGLQKLETSLRLTQVLLPWWYRLFVCSLLLYIMTMQSSCSIKFICSCSYLDLCHPCKSWSVFSWFVISRSVPQWCPQPHKRSPKTVTSLSGWPSSSQASWSTRRQSPLLLSRRPSTSSNPSPPPPLRRQCRPCHRSLRTRWRPSACFCGCQVTQRCCWKKGSTPSVCCAWCWVSQTMEKAVRLSNTNIRHV